MNHLINPQASMIARSAAMSRLEVERTKIGPTSHAHFDLTSDAILLSSAQLAARRFGGRVYGPCGHRRSIVANSIGEKIKVRFRASVYSKRNATIGSSRAARWAG